MNAPDLQIRIGIIAALEAVLPTTPIRDMMAGPDDELPYILLSTQTNAQDRIKHQFGMQSTLMIQVVGKKTLGISRYEVDQIADTVMQTLIPQDSSAYPAITGWHVVQVLLESSNDTVTTDSDGNSARKLIRLRFILREAN